MSPITVLVLSAIGILAIAGFVVAISPFNKAKTAMYVFGGFVILAGIVYGIQTLEFAFANSVLTAEATAFANTGSIPWYYFPALSDWQLALVYAAIAILGFGSAYSLYRAIRKGMRRNYTVHPPIAHCGFCGGPHNACYIRQY